MVFFSEFNATGLQGSKKVGQYLNILIMYFIYWTLDVAVVKTKQCRDFFFDKTRR